LKDFLRFFTKFYPKEILSEKQIFRNFVILSVFFVILLIFPGIFLFFVVHPLFYSIVLFFLIFIMVYILRSSNLIRGITKRHLANYNKFSKKYR